MTINILTKIRGYIGITVNTIVKRNVQNDPQIPYPGLRAWICFG